MRCAAFVAAATVVATASAQTVVNGDFSLSVPRNSTGNGWTTSSIDSNGGWRSTGGNPAGMFIINDAGAAASDPTIAQNITGLVVGTTYVITGNYTSWHANSAPAGAISFRVLVGGVAIFQSSPTPLRQWQVFSAPFTATSTTMLLELKAEVDRTDNDFAVDNLGIAVVPAPVSLATLGAGSILLFRRRR